MLMGVLHKVLLHDGIVAGQDDCQLLLVHRVHEDTAHHQPMPANSST